MRKEMKKEYLKKIDDWIESQKHPDGTIDVGGGFDGDNGLKDFTKSLKKLIASIIKKEKK